MSNFIPASKLRMEQNAQRTRRNKIEAQNKELCASLSKLLEDDDGIETINTCLGRFIESGVTEDHAAEWIQHKLTDKFRRNGTIE